MFNLGFSEIIIIGVLALVLIGPKQLPEMARVLGRLIAEFKRATSDLSGGLLDIKSELQKPVREGMDEIRKMKDDLINKVQEEALRTQQAIMEDKPENTENTEKTARVHIDDLDADGKNEPKS